ncbi:MAG: hypothetical protein GY877_00945 [Hyphomicrobium sp.]|nr:hypothetical protein [Hyphomicrobium sp.]
MIELGTVLELLALVVGVLAAIETYRAVKVKPRPVWEDDPKLKPRNMAEHAFGTVMAREAANFWSGRHAVKAAIYGLLATGLAAFAWIAKS